MNHLADPPRVRVLVAPAQPQDSGHDAPRRADIAQGLAEVLGGAAVTTCRYESAARQVRHDRPELVLLVGSCLSDRAEYGAVRRACDEVDARLAFWALEDPFEFDAHVKFSGLADFVFSVDRWAAEHYSRERVWHLPPAANPRRFGQPLPLAWASRARDVFFCGRGHTNRRQLLADLSPTLAHCRAEIFGSEWDTPAVPQARNVELAASDLPEAYASSRVVLNIGRGASAANARYLLDPSTPGARTFEAAMAGSCQLLFADSLEVLDYFELGSEILLFDGPADFRVQLERLLADGELAQSIGAAARRRALRDHTYAARARTLLEHAGCEPVTEPLASAA